MNVKLHHRQSVALTTDATEVLFGGAAGGGKAGHVNTSVLTLYGVKRLGEIEVGDVVFDENGQRCNVIAVSEVMHGRPCYKLTFDDGSTIIADEQHQWITLTDKERMANKRRTPEFRERRRANRTKRGTGKKPWLAERNAAKEHEYLDPMPPSVRTTKEIHDTQQVRGRTNHSVPVAGEVVGDPTVDPTLPLAPYLLGVWLADGTAVSGEITTGDVDVMYRIRDLGYKITKHKYEYSYGVLGIVGKLKQLRVFGNKHIPEPYHLASATARMELFRGLMDSDGCCNKDGGCEYTSVLLRLAQDVQRLALSLGIKATLCESRASLNGRDMGAKYVVKFTTEKRVFHLKRKLKRLPTDTRGVQDKRYIIKVEQVESVPVRCIQVDSPSSCFLWGDTLIPTHNSFLMRVACIYWATEVPGLQCYLFRRLSDDLHKNHMTGAGSFPDLMALWLDEKRVKFDAQKNVFRFWNGSTIYLCHCQYEKDLIKYQGSEVGFLCCKKTTPILMGDGSYKAIGDLQVGDFVQTLAGPKRVNKVYPSRMAECVEVSDADGSVVVPATHRMLTTAGWDEAVSVQTLLKHSTTPQEPLLVTGPYQGSLEVITPFLRRSEAFVSLSGLHEVVDIEVDEVNHYISQDGFIHANCLDEGTHFTGAMYRYLRGRLRLGGTVVPPQHAGKLPRVLIASNPGGIGHSFFKSEFIDSSKPYLKRRMKADDGGLIRQYIPALLTDNPTLMANDPHYADRLRSLGDPVLVRAMLQGDWNIVAGGALDDVWGQWLITDRFAVPSNWPVYRALDWGSAHPFSVGWWTVSNGEELDDGRCWPAGTAIRLHEWYGAKSLDENEGLKLSAREVAEGVLAIEDELRVMGWITGKVKPGPADNEIFAEKEVRRTISSLMKEVGLTWERSHKGKGSRVNGLQVLRDRMKNTKTGEGAGVVFMDHCSAVIATLPVLPRCKINREDVDTKSIDHAYDEVRYFVTWLEKRGAAIVDVRWAR